MMRLICLLLTVLAAAPAGYDLLEQKNGVSVYRRKDAQAIDIYAEGNIAATPEQVRAVLLDYPDHPKFMQHMAEIRVLGRGPNSMLVYQRMKLPMLSDRDMVLLVTSGAEGRDLWTHFKAVTDRGPPPQKGAVRVTDHEGGWRLSPGPGGTTHAQYRMRIDLAGSLPGWMARSQEGKDVPDLFQTIQRQAQLGTGSR